MANMNNANATNHKKQDTIEQINFLRAFGVLAVIAIHATGYFTEIKKFNNLVLINLLTDVFSQFAVPLFILISGFVLARNYRNNFPIRQFYKKRIRSIIPQYLIFSVLYTCFINSEVMRNNALSTNVTLILRNIWQSDASYHLWFFAIIIQCYIFYPFIIKIYDHFKIRNRAELLISLMLVIQVAFMVGKHTPYLAATKINFIAYLFYFGLGIYSCDHYEKLKSGFNRLTPLFLATTLALTIGASYFIIVGLTTGYRYNTIPNYYFIGSELIYPILRISSFLLLFNLANNLVRKKSIVAKALYKIGDYSFGIYLIHIFFNQSAIKILKNYNINYNNWQFYLIIFVVPLVLSYMSVRLITYLPYSYYIIGYMNKSRNNKRT
ncbi:acyltransferase [Desulfosporosinus sp. BG]|uniref:acyltransferase n=1 Tax=Desulfosporosinus sp. BG TaxID=1633135 RepID=UPI0008591846|nr:acyltransferase [Desulfosporosinus sp. BG]ODA41158.1 Integral membrane protein [Desulfosporosinus sp. BG]